jgi:small subunit ribosomal protein S20
MPHSRSAAKRVRQNRKNRQANLGVRSSMRSQEKLVRELVAAGKKAEALAALSVAYKRFDKAAKVGVIHENTAANHKRKLARQVARLS